MENRKIFNRKNKKIMEMTVMKMIDKIKEIEKYVCNNFEELDLDDPDEIVYVASNITDLLSKIFEEIG